MVKTKEAPARLADSVDRWLEEQEEHNDCADAMINEYIASLSCPAFRLG